MENGFNVLMVTFYATNAMIAWEGSLRPARVAEYHWELFGTE
jgi:hypothetical protein